MRSSLAAALALFSADTAFAACSAPYTTDALLGDMVGVEAGLRSGKTADALAAAKKVEAGLPCLDEVLPTMIAGRTYRAVAGGYVAGGDAARGAAWFTTAVEIESGFDYGLEDLPEKHPIRDAWNVARQMSPSDPTLIDGKSWIPGKVYLDGRNQAGNTPGARPGRPHLLQYNDGTTVKGWLIDGGAIPAELLTVPVGSAVVVAAGKAPKPPKEPKAPKAVPVAPAPAPAPAAPAPEEPVVAEVPKPAKAPKPAPEPEPAPAPTVAKATDPEKVKEPKAAKEKEKPPAEVTSTGAMVIERQRPWEKTPLMIGGTTLCLGAGFIYWQALQHHDRFFDSPDIDTTKEVLAEQSAANTFTLAASAVGAVGLGTLTWGVILDGGDFHLPLVHFRW